MGINDNKNILAITPFLRTIIKSNPKNLKKGSMFLKFKATGSVVYIKGSKNNLFELESDR